MAAKKEERKKKKEKSERWQFANEKRLDSVDSIFCVRCKWTGKAHLNGQKKIGNHKGIVDTIHPSTLVFAL
jgi:hypothetical protein